MQSAITSTSVSGHVHHRDVDKDEDDCRQQSSTIHTKRLAHHLRAMAVSASIVSPSPSPSPPLQTIAASTALSSTLIPIQYHQPLFIEHPITNQHLRWMEQKWKLKQDMFLIGSTGPLRRHLALHFAAIHQFPIEYICLTRDSTESDLKQRREIIQGGSSVYINQQVLLAALHGRLLLIEGLELAERNVLPVINNLLENREMALEDGSFLVSPQRYATLMKQGLTQGGDNMRLIPCHPDFRVVAIGVPVPPFPGNPLDPPLRSRFQSRRIDALPTSRLLTYIQSIIHPTRDQHELARIQLLLAFHTALQNLTQQTASQAGAMATSLAYHHMPQLSEPAIFSIALMLARFPGISLPSILPCIYPYHLAITHDDARVIVGKLVDVMFRPQQPTQGSTHVTTKNEEKQVATVPPPLDESYLKLMGPCQYLISDVTHVSHSHVHTSPVSTSTSTSSHPALIHMLNISSQHAHVNDVLLTFTSTSTLRQHHDDITNKHQQHITWRVPGGSSIPTLPSTYTAGIAHHMALSQMLYSHVCGRDLCIAGPAGSGKSYLVHQFATALGYLPIQTLFLYKDMSSRDLLQRRTTTSRGATVWQNTPLVTAITRGHLAVLDGIHRLPIGTLSILNRLIQDRELVLFDGTRYIRADRYASLQHGEHAMTVEQLEEQRIFAIHPNFRLVAMATLPSVQEPWLTNDVMHAFHFHHLNLIGIDTPAPCTSSSTTTPNKHISSFTLIQQSLSASSRITPPSIATLLQTIMPSAPRSILTLLQLLTQRMSELAQDPLLQLDHVLSLRQLIRIVKRTTVYPNELYITIYNNMMLRYLPAAKRDVIIRVLKQVGIEPQPAATSACVPRITSTSTRLTIGSTSIPIIPPKDPQLVPDIVFFEIARHMHILEDMLKDFVLGEHLLLVGNQGVGKNKLVDRLLQLMQREREYIQLHRDTTVQSLTLSPSLVGGVVVYQDSPLVRAMLLGRILMVDEVDKAPTEVVCVLKALLEDGEILLTDGRRFVTTKSPLYAQYRDAPTGTQDTSDYTVCLVHPGFRVFALANPPGWPFLGNDFFANLGDVFACHAVDNPDQASEIELLKAYGGPNIHHDILVRLTAAFADLRSMTEDGMLSYPYSTRECVAIVKHMSLYPSDPIANVLASVLDFDSYDDALMQTLTEIFHKHGIPTNYKVTAQTTIAQTVASASSSDKPVTHLARPFPLPPPVLLGRILYGTNSLLASTPHTVRITSISTIPIFTPPSYEAPLRQGIDESDDPENYVMPHVWKQVDRITSSRAAKFSEELFSFKHRKGTVVDIQSSSSSSSLSPSPSYIYILTVGPFALHIYDLTSTRPVTSTINLTTSLVRYFANDHFIPSPSMYVMSSLQHILIYQPHFAVLMIIDPISRHVTPLAIHLPDRQNTPRKHHDRFVEVRDNLPCFITSHPHLEQYGVCLLWAATSNVITLCHIGMTSTSQPHKDVATRASTIASRSHMVRLSLPSHIAIRRIDMLHADRWLIRDTHDTEYDVVIHGIEWMWTRMMSDMTCPITVSMVDIHRKYEHDAEGLPPHHYISNAIPIPTSQPAIKNWQASHQQQYARDLVVSSTSQPSQQQSHIIPEHIHMSSSLDVHASMLLGLHESSKLTHLGTQKLSHRQLLATILAYPRDVASTDEMSLTPRTRPLYRISRWLYHTGELLNVLSYDKFVIIELIDVYTASARSLRIDKPIKNQNQGTFTTTAQSEHFIIASTEMADGRVCLMEQGGRIRVMEYRTSVLQAQGKAWVDMQGGSQQQRAGSGEERGEGGNDGDGGDAKNADGAGGVGSGGMGGEGSGGSGGKGTGGQDGEGSGGSGKGDGGSGGGSGSASLKDMLFNRDGSIRTNRQRELNLSPDSSQQQQAATILDKAMNAAKQATTKKLTPGQNKVGLDAQLYQRLYTAVAKEVQQLRVILEGAEARERERTWVKNQTQGELDDTRLIDGATGERTIFKRRGIADPLFGRIQKKPKRLRFVMDVSSSMARFNGSDRRLDRMIATSVMIMEAFQGFGHKYDYSIVGHDGQSPLIPFVPWSKPPTTQAQRLEIIEMMYWNASFCGSGDHTLAAAVHAIHEVTQEEGDDYFVFVLSDANLSMYGVNADTLARVMMSDPRVNTYAIFIAGEANAESMIKALPIGHGYVCQDTAQLPKIFKEIFTSSLLRNPTGAAQL